MGAALSPAAITRLTTAWQAERDEFMKRSLKDRDYVYIWVDGIHFNVRLSSDDRLCCLVIVGVRLDGTKELIALQGGYRESTDSWADLLRDCKKRGMRPGGVADASAWRTVRRCTPRLRAISRLDRPNS